MSGNNLAELIRQSREKPGPAEPPSAIEAEADEFPSYAKLRGPRQVAFMLELRHAAGDSEAFDYGLLVRVRFDPSAGLTLLFAGGMVSIRGKNLRPLYDGVLTHRVTWVAVTSDPDSAARDPKATVVTAIEVEAAG